MGNGDFLVAMGGPAENLSFHLGKADLWELRPDGGPRALGRMDLDLPGMKGADYRITQDIFHAITTGAFTKDNVTLRVEAAVAATENLLWIKLSAEGGNVAGSARFADSAKKTVPASVEDDDRPVTIGREGHGGGRYYFDGEIGDVVISDKPILAVQGSQPGQSGHFDGKTTCREMKAMKMAKTVNIGTWININRVGEANYIVSKGEWIHAYSLGLSGGKLRFAVNGSFIETPTALALGKWHHVGASFDGHSMKVFIDDKLVARKDDDGTAGTRFVERHYDQGTNGIVRSAGAACAMRILGEKNDNFTVSPGKPVILVVTASGHANTKDYGADAIKRAEAATTESLAASRRTHEAWWAEFRSRSFVEIPDKKLEQHYYLSHYAMASASRLPHYPPGLYGWTLSDQTPRWGGAYFLNYNFFAPFYGLYAANHVEQAMPCNDAVIDALDLGREWAKDEGRFERLCANSLKLKDAMGILLPVSILPHGVTGAPTTWGQRSNASYACVPLASTWYATYDLGFAKKAYPFVREVATFWENFLVLENGRYVDHNDAALENSGRDTNPIVAMAMIRQVMALAIDMGTSLGVDASRHAKWRDIRDRLSDYPTCTVGDLPKGSRVALPDSPETRSLPVFRYSEKGCAWQNDNAVGIQHIFPGNGIGLGVRPELLGRARNQIKVMARWIDLNGCNSFYPAAVRVGYDPNEILKHLRHWSDTCHPNGMRADNPHGMEMFSVVPCTIQEMLMQSHDGVLRLFPCWPEDQDARFGTLRARGAFLVSAEMKNGTVCGVRILSEKGRDCTVQNPWPGRKVSLAGRETLTGERFTFKTRPEEIIEFKPEGGKP